VRKTFTAFTPPGTDEESSVDSIEMDKNDGVVLVKGKGGVRILRPWQAALGPTLCSSCIGLENKEKVQRGKSRGS